MKFELSEKRLKNFYLLFNCKKIIMNKFSILFIVFLLMTGLGAAKAVSDNPEYLKDAKTGNQHDEFDSEEKMQEKANNDKNNDELARSSRIAGLENAKANLKGGTIAQTVIGGLIDDSKDNNKMPSTRPDVDEIRDEDDVSFEMREGRKGMNAVDVHRTD